MTFETKKGGSKDWVIDVEADNQKEAKEICKKLWYKNHLTVHAFKLEAVKLKDSEELLHNYFKQCERSEADDRL